MRGRGARNSTKSTQMTTQLHLTTAQGNEGEVTNLLLVKADPNARDANQETPLHLAAARGKTTIADALLKAKAELNPQNLSGHTPLQQAALNGHTDVFNLLLGAGAIWDKPALFNQQSLYCAVVGGNSQIVKTLIDAKAEVTAADAKGSTALHTASSIEVAKILLTAGASLEAKSPSGTPLATAASVTSNCYKGFLLTAATEPDTTLDMLISVNKQIVTPRKLIELMNHLLTPLIEQREAIKYLLAPLELRFKEFSKRMTLVTTIQELSKQILALTAEFQKVRDLLKKLTDAIDLHFTPKILRAVKEIPLIRDPDVSEVKRSFQALDHQFRPYLNLLDIKKYFSQAEHITEIEVIKSVADTLNNPAAKKGHNKHKKKVKLPIEIQNALENILGNLADSVFAGQVKNIFIGYLRQLEEQALAKQKLAKEVKAKPSEPTPAAVPVVAAEPSQEAVAQAQPDHEVDEAKAVEAALVAAPVPMAPVKSPAVKPISYAALLNKLNSSSSASQSTTTSLLAMQSGPNDLVVKMMNGTTHSPVTAAVHMAQLNGIEHKQEKTDLMTLLRQASTMSKSAATLVPALALYREIIRQYEAEEDGRSAKDTRAYATACNDLACHLADGSAVAKANEHYLDLIIKSYQQSPNPTNRYNFLAFADDCRPQLTREQKVLRCQAFLDLNPADYPPINWQHRK